MLQHIQGKPYYIQGLALPEDSGIHWGSWNTILCGLGSPEKRPIEDIAMPTFI
jgi:hypothetical protein